MLVLDRILAGVMQIHIHIESRVPEEDMQQLPAVLVLCLLR